MDTKPYDIDSPYTSLTLKSDENHFFRQQRIRRRERYAFVCIRVAVAICILCAAFSAICAAYCLRASRNVVSAEDRILKHVTETNTPYGHAEALKDAVTNKPNIEIDAVDYDNEIEDDFEDYEDYDSDADDSSGYIDVGDDDDDEEEEEDEYDDDEYTDDDDNEFKNDFDITDDDLSDDNDDLESSVSIEDVGIDYSDSGYESDDEDDSLEGSANGDEQAFKERFRRESVGQKPKKPKKNRKNRNKGNGKKSKQGKVKMAKLKFLPAAQFDGSVTTQTIEKHCAQYSKYGTKECVHVKEMEGQLCNNQSFVPDDKDQALRILKPEPWVNKNTSPVDISNSVLTARSSGVHLVYAQVTFSGYEAQKSAYIVVTSATGAARRLSCNADTAANIIDTEDTFEKNLSTCSIFGLLSLKPGDTLELQTGNRYAAIERVEGATYFGIVQLNKNK